MTASFFSTLLLTSCLFIQHAAAAPRANHLLTEMTDELNREMTLLGDEEIPPYFMAYSVTDVTRIRVAASFGALTSSDRDDSRLLRVEVRVGDYDLDNSHELRDQFSFSGGGNIVVARDGGKDALNAAIWQETNRAWREAVEKYTKVKTNITIKVAEEDSSADFSRERLHPHYHEKSPDIQRLVGDMSVWEERMRTCSRPFLADENIYGGQASFSFTIERKYLVTSEGTEISQNLTYAGISINGFIKSDDGMELPLYKNYHAFTPDGLPDNSVILNDVNEMIVKLGRLRAAPVIEPYTGPAILSGRAAAVFFHEILGHRIEGHRQKSEYDGQTFKKHIGSRILPEHMDIVFDPTRRTYGDDPLMGFYRYDDEGVEAQKVRIVNNGILENFLMSRSPIEDFPSSNGHGRAQAGYRPVSRQSNMLVTSDHSIPDTQLRERLIDLCREQEKPYGLFVKDIQGGFTFTGRSIPNVFNLMPVEVYRIYTDGRPDELVRGGDFVGTPLVMFSMISEAGEGVELFNGICGAESGSVPVAALSPPLLVRQVEVQKKAKSQERPPILPRPDSEKNL